MELKTTVKVNGVNSLTDARFFSGAGAQLLGFNFDKNSSRYIATEDVFQIKEWLAFPEIVGEFNATQTIDQINNIVGKLKLDYAEVGPQVEDSLLESVQCRVIKRIAIESLSEIDSLEARIQSFPDNVTDVILDFVTGGFLWNVIRLDESNRNTLKELCSQFNVILSLNVSKDNAEEILDTLEPKGLEIHSGDEIKTGVRSFDDIADLMEELEAEF